MSELESKYWKDMFITRSLHVKSEENAIISVETPIEFDKHYEELQLEIYHAVDDISNFSGIPKKIQSGEPVICIQRKELYSKIGNELTQFIRNHNQMYTGIYELIDEKLLKSLFQLNIYVFILRYPKTSKIMGCMMTLIFESTAELKDKPLFALTSYLCVHKQIRNKGICMLLIRKALQTAYIENIYCSYYLEEKPFSTSGILVKRWMRPINVQSALDKGFKFELPSEREKTKRRLAYRIPKLDTNFTSIVIDEKNNLIQQSFDFLKSCYVDSNKWSWKPNIKEWKEWVTSKTFETIALISKQQEIVGLITIQYKQIYVPQTQTTSHIAFIPFHILNPLKGFHSDLTKELLNSTIIQCSMELKTQKIDMLYIFECGYITSNTLESCKAVPAGDMHVDFYNFKHVYSHSDILMPLL